jgi:hypothetical protein
MKKISCVSFIFILLACQESPKKLTALYSIPGKLKEVSGIIYLPETKMLWMLEDHGNPNVIYGIDSTGKIKDKITIENTKNIDWEDLTKDKEGNLYIGDFGNNDNKRKDLSIYKIDKNSLLSQRVVPAYKISFVYPEQKKFPPKKTEMFYDVEAFFEFKNNFYLFTKNRSKGFNGSALLYKIPNVTGYHEAILMGEFNTCDTYDQCAITAAAISPDETKVVLLTHDKILLLENFQKDNFLKGTKTVLELNHFSQKESVSFRGNDTLFIADERTKKTGGKVYTVSIKELKSKS